MAIIKHLTFLALLAALYACNASRVIKPLEKGEKRIGASLGGPAITYANVPMPLPLSSVTYSQGLDTGITLTASLQTTSMLFGVAHVDATLGIKAYESASGKFGITGSPGIHLLYDFYEGNYRNYPQLEALSWWRYGSKNHLLYGGLGTWIELVRVKAHNEVQDNEFMPYLMLGHQWNRARWSFLAELKYLGFQHNTSRVVVDYVSPANRGALGAYFGASWRITK